MGFNVIRSTSKVIHALLLGIWLTCCSGIAYASETASDMSAIRLPPRNVKDILGVLEQANQNQILFEKAKKIVGLPVPTGSPEALNNFYYRRAVAENVLGDIKAAAQDFKKAATEYPNQDLMLKIDENFAYAKAEATRGNLLLAIQIQKDLIPLVPHNQRAWIISVNRNVVQYCLDIGDFDCAQAALDGIEQTFSGLRNSREPYIRKLNWESGYEHTRARLFLAQGKFIEAERALRKAFVLNQQGIEAGQGATLNSGQDALDTPARILQDSTTDSKQFYSSQLGVLADLATAFLGQRRLIDAEYWAREALLLSINRFGVNSSQTSGRISALAKIILEEGRPREAVLLANTALKIALQVNNYSASPAIISARRTLAGALVADGQYSQADKVYAEMLEGLKIDPEMAARYPVQDLDWALALVKTGKSSQAVSLTTEMLTRDGAHMQKSSPSYAMLTAFNAAALQSAGQGTQALAEFKKSVPILINQARNDTENATETVRQTQRMTFILEEYLASLAQQVKVAPSGAGAAEAFQIADLARGSGVQRALTSSAARANIADPQLSKLARREQDLQQQINTLSELLTGLLSSPSNQQLPAIQAKLRADITAFKSQREELKKEIERKFPDYAELVEPKPASIESVQKALKNDEVLVSWYFGDKTAYVWAIGKDKPAQFAQLSIGRAQMAKEVMQLRKSLDPGVTTIDEIPAFDVTLAYQLYQQVLAPVQSSLVGKKVMLTVAHAELGQLPLSLLVTKPIAQPTKIGLIPFSGYKAVPWLVRDIAVAQLPSVTALTALRSLPPGNANRKNFIGFGDPYFSSQQEQQAAKSSQFTQLATRGMPLSLRSTPKTTGVSSAELALLPRLPDTSLELEEVGKALGAVAGDIYLHQYASVKQVMSADLSNRKVVMFATHGLVPGELNGLTQPALALSSPEVTGDQDDGLLTMDQVLTLKLDADWVVLSACNTASGDGAGSEAVSGLGRAFFYAGAKALLVSNWPVDSVASKTLMIDLFQRQQQSPATSKAELLRQSMLNEIDHGGMKEGGNLKYAYAHPLFWAPFVVVGD
jgi:tetratricopeptide (TPR) repeat protein